MDPLKTTLRLLHLARHDLQQHGRQLEHGQVLLLRPAPSSAVTCAKGGGEREGGEEAGD